MSVNDSEDGDELTMTEAADIVSDARERYTDEYVTDVLESARGDIVEAAIVFGRNGGADNASGSGTYGIDEALVDRADVRGSPNVIEQTYVVKLPDDIDHHLAWRGRFAELAERVAKNDFDDGPTKRPRGSRVNALNLNPGEYGSIWLVTLSTDRYPGSGPEHQYRHSDRIVPDDADDEEKPNWMD